MSKASAVPPIVTVGTLAEYTTSLYLRAVFGSVTDSVVPSDLVTVQALSVTAMVADSLVSITSVKLATRVFMPAALHQYGSAVILTVTCAHPRNISM